MFQSKTKILQSKTKILHAISQRSPWKQRYDGGRAVFSREMSIAADRMPSRLKSNFATSFVPLVPFVHGWRRKQALRDAPVNHVVMGIACGAYRSHARWWLLQRLACVAADRRDVARVLWVRHPLKRRHNVIVETSSILRPNIPGPVQSRPEMMDSHTNLVGFILTS